MSRHPDFVIPVSENTTLHFELVFRRDPHGPGKVEGRAKLIVAGETTHVASMTQTSEAGPAHGNSNQPFERVAKIGLEMAQLRLNGHDGPAAEKLKDLQEEFHSFRNTDRGSTSS